LQPSGRTTSQAIARTQGRTANNAGKGNNRTQPTGKRNNER